MPNTITETQIPADIVIKYTRDYDIFKYYGVNRTVRERIVKKIQKSVDKNGQLLAPVKCDPMMYVVDGQNRIEAFRRYNLPVAYYIDPNANASECPTLNSALTPWDGNDFIKSFSDSGNENYSTLKNLLEMFPELGMFLVRDLITRKCKKEDRRNPQEIKEGEFIFPYDKQDEILDELEFINSFSGIKELIKHGRKDSFYKAIACCYECESINNQRLHRLLGESAGKFGAFNGFKDCLDCIESIYNYRSHDHLYVKTEILKMLAAQKKGGK